MIAVLGMHRSGTSWLTGTLQEAGLSLGECHTWNKHNERGNRENQAFVDLHDAILEANAAAWDNPPTRVVWGEEHVAEARRLLEAHADEPTFGFKDPRALLVLDGWKQLYPSIEFVGIYRHPNAVAKSLEKRSFMTWEDSLRLWYAYNKVLFGEYRKNRFPLLNFDDDEPVLDRKVHDVARDMGLSHAGGDEKFYTAELKHNASTGGPALPWKVRRLYNKLDKHGL
ncbi:MAG: sulfotransferase family protein [Halioglobus sp.]|nr:sulfotransferase family protein [Halioglobus sp.]